MINDLTYYKKNQYSTVLNDCKTSGGEARAANNHSLWWLIQCRCADQKGRKRGVKEPPILPFSPSLSLLVPHKSKNDYTCKYTGPRPRRQLCFTEMPLMFCLPTNRCAWKIANDPHVSPRLRAEKISLSHADTAISPEMPKINGLSGFFPRNLHVSDVLPLILVTNTLL